MFWVFGHEAWVAQTVKNLTALWESWVRPLSPKDPLEKRIATRSSFLAWRFPWAEGPDGLQSVGWQRVGHDWATESALTNMWDLGFLTEGYTHILALEGEVLATGPSGSPLCGHFKWRWRRIFNDLEEKFLMFYLMKKLVLWNCIHYSMTLFLHFLSYTYIKCVVVVQPLSHVDSLRPHGLQHTRLACSSPSPGVCSHSSPLSPWYHPTISSSAGPFSFSLQSFPASRYFPMSQLSASSSQSTRASALALFLHFSAFSKFPTINIHINCIDRFL